MLVSARRWRASERIACRTSATTCPSRFQPTGNCQSPAPSPRRSRSADADAPLAFDFAPDRAGLLRAVSRGEEQVSIRHVNGHIIVPKESLQAGENRLTFTFDAGDAPLNRSADFLYTLFVPARAHLALPCFDQPDLKARWSLALEIPDTWEAISNGAEVGRDARDDRIRVRFAETPPVATYLFAFAAGRFSVDTAQRDGRTFRMFHRETDAAKVARNRDAIFDLHAAALAWLERYTGIKYPFGKFDFLLIPAFQFGGMEHPGAIFYNATGLMLDESATQDQKLGRASLIAHETSHMWFGDLVTMRWFSDVWMKEVFANFMAAKIVNPSFPGINHDLRFLLAYYPAAYDVDRTAGTNEIRQPLANLDDAGTLYGAIIYQKAPIVMRQLETMMGAEPFRDGLREYLNTLCIRERGLDGLDRAARWTNAGGSRCVEPRVGGRARSSDDPDRADDLERPDRPPGRDAAGSDREARAALESTNTSGYR